MVPVVFLAAVLLVQFAHAYYGRQVVPGAAQDGAAAAARRNAEPAEGAALADQLIGEAAANLFASHETTVSTTSDAVTVTVSGKVASLLPFFGTITVRATSTAPIEQFTPQGASP
jgi:Flp pilus assembly protein TadG